MHRFAHLFFAGLLVLAGARGAISFGPQGVWTHPITFDSLPALSEWATRSMPGGSGSFSQTDALDAAVQTNTASGFSTALLLDSATAPAPHTLATWSSSRQAVYFAPAGIAAGMLLATLVNDAGSSFSSVYIGYDIVIPPGASTGAEEIPGQRVYFSLTGQSNSWQVIPEVSGLSGAGSRGATLNFLAWPPGALLYLLWVQDNAVRSPDTVYIIDNFYATPDGPPPPPCFIAQPTNTTGVENGFLSLSATVGCSITASYQWFHNGQAITGATAALFSVPRLRLTDAGTYFLVASNMAGASQSSNVVVTVIPDDAPPRALAAYQAQDISSITDTVVIVFSERVETNSATAVENYFIRNRSIADDVPVIFDAAVSGESNVLLHVSNLSTGASYTIRVSSVMDDSSGLHVLSPNPTELPVQTFAVAAVPANHPWKYSETTNNVAPAEWTAPDFDDSTWPTGLAAFGLPMDEVIPAPFVMQTMIRTADIGGPITTLFRTKFQAHVSATNFVVQLAGVFDDGAVAYLNGSEVWRVRLPDGTLTPATLAGNAPEGAGGHPLDGPVYLYAPGQLREGMNTLAVEVHQASAVSGDVVMGLAMHLSQTNNVIVDCFPTLRLSLTNSNSVVITWSCGGVLQVSPALGPAASWTDVFTQSRTFVTNLSGSAAFFRLR